MTNNQIREQTARIIAASVDCGADAAWLLFDEARAALDLPADHPRHVAFEAASKAGGDLGNVTRLMGYVIEEHGPSGIDDTRRHPEAILDGREI